MGGRGVDNRRSVGGRGTIGSVIKVAAVTFVALSLVAACGDDEQPNPAESANPAEAAHRQESEDFCSVVADLDDATEASVAAVFGQGFDAPVLTPAQVEEAFGRLRKIQDSLQSAAPRDAPKALETYLRIRSDYMDAVSENGYDPDPDNLDEEDPRVRAWQDNSTRSVEDDLGRSSGGPAGLGDKEAVHGRGLTALSVPARANRTTRHLRLVRLPNRAPRWFSALPGEPGPARCHISRGTTEASVTSHGGEGGGGGFGAAGGCLW